MVFNSYRIEKNNSNGEYKQHKKSVYRKLIGKRCNFLARSRKIQEYKATKELVEKGEVPVEELQKCSNKKFFEAEKNGFKINNLQQYTDYLESNRTGKANQQRLINLFKQYGKDYEKIS